VTYNLDMPLLAKTLGEDEPSRGGPADENTLKSREAKGRIRYTGFIAQEVESAAKALGYDFSGVDVPVGEGDHYGLRYAQFTVPLVKAVQELDAENKALRAELASQKAALEALQQAVSALQTNSVTHKTGMK
jgi:hypothetical protein